MCPLIRDGISDLTNNTELQSKLISNMPTILLEGLRKENPDNMVQIQAITDAVTKATMTQGATQAPNDQPTRADTSLFWTEEYFETEFKSVIEETNKISTSIEHTFLHSSFSNTKMTPAAMADLIHKVE